MCNSCARLKARVRRPSGKKRRNQCPEDEQREESRLPKCRKRKRAPRTTKCLTKIERILLRIQPPMSDRERYINPRHINCFLEEPGILCLKKVEMRPSPSQAPKPKHKPCESGKKREMVERAVDGEAKKPEDDERVEEGENRSKANGETVKKDEGEKNKNSEDKEGKNMDKNSGRNETERKENALVQNGRVERVERRKKKKKLKPKPVAADEKNDSKISIRSDDSKICLKDLGLTREERKKIEENRGRVHPKSENKIVKVEKKKERDNGDTK